MNYVAQGGTIKTFSCFGCPDLLEYQWNRTIVHYFK